MPTLSPVCVPSVTPTSSLTSDSGALITVWVLVKGFRRFADHGRFLWDGGLARVGVIDLSSSSASASASSSLDLISIGCLVLGLSSIDSLLTPQKISIIGFPNQVCTSWNLRWLFSLILATVYIIPVGVHNNKFYKLTKDGLENVTQR